MGETSTGLMGEKYLFKIKGDRSAIPIPPFVNASRIP